ncbi:glucokinase [Xylographa soralifera]|nr:glucokinase [Xylographa soralifera]
MSLVQAARAIASQFEYTDADITRCGAQFIREMRLGLQEKTPSMCQIPTYISRVALSTETVSSTKVEGLDNDWSIKGIALAVDLGGTNLRVCSVCLQGGATVVAHQRKTIIPRELMLATHPSDLFGFIAREIEALLQTYHPEPLSKTNESYNPLSTFCLGFTFSFPAYQNAINSGTLLRWTKGFDIQTAVGQDVCKLLQDEIDLLRLPVKVTALVNDAAGTIMARAYTLPLSEIRTSIGAIIGTEKLSKISKPLDGDYDKSIGEMFMSIEWGSFDNRLSVMPNTQYDAILDEYSVNRGSQMFEKRVSGMFLGELLRLAVRGLHTNIALDFFSMLNRDEDREPSGLLTPWTVDSSILSAAAIDTTPDLGVLKQKMQEVFNYPIEYISNEEARAMKLIADAIGRRAGRLAGMALGAVNLQSKQMSEPANVIKEKDTMRFPDQQNEADFVDVAVDGSVIEHYPGFEQYMREALRSITDIGVEGEKRIKIGIAKDGSSVGAAIIALLVAEQNNIHHPI